MSSHTPLLSPQQHAARQGCSHKTGCARNSGRSKLTLDLQRLNGDVSTVRLLFPDEVSALTLKAFATTVRRKPTDIVDTWRCLEICLAARIDPTTFSHGTPADAAAIIRKLFGRNGPGMQTITGQYRLSKNAANQRYTRIRALMARMLPGA